MSRLPTGPPAGGHGESTGVLQAIAQYDETARDLFLRSFTEPIATGLPFFDGVPLRPGEKPRGTKRART